METSEIVLKGNKWLFLYSLPCHFGRLKVFEKLLNSENFNPLRYLNENSCREEVRDYFYGVHNIETYGDRNFSHMLIPYGVRSDEAVVLDSFNWIDELPDELRNVKLSKRQRSRMSKYGLRLGDVIYIHGGWVVDSEY